MGSPKSRYSYNQKSIFPNPARSQQNPHPDFFVYLGTCNGVGLGGERTIVLVLMAKGILLAMADFFCTVKKCNPPLIMSGYYWRNATHRNSGKTINAPSCRCWGLGYRAQQPCSF
jgi:hypothetical protein